TSSFTRFVRTKRYLIMAGRLTKCGPRHQQQECHHTNLRIGPYPGVVSKFWAVEDVITRSRTASGHVDGAVLACTIMFIRLLMTILRTSRRSPRLDDERRFDCCGGSRASKEA